MSSRSYSSAQAGGGAQAKQWLAVAGGAAATLLAIWAVFQALGQIIDVVRNLAWLLVAGYTVAIALYFWASRCYRDGLTGKELLFAAFWPVALLRSIRRGVDALREEVTGLRTTRTREASDEVIVSGGWARILGVFITGFSVLLFFKGIHAAIGVTTGLIVLSALIWMIGMVVQFWVAEAWRGGITGQDVIMVVLWPVGMARVIIAGVKRFGASS